MTSENSIPAVPSQRRKLLISLIGRRIKSFIRYSWWPGAEAVTRHCYAESEVFSLTAGPAALTLDNDLMIGFTSNPSQNSVLVWVEKNPMGACVAEDPMEKDAELSPIAASDARFSNDFWKSLCGQQIVSVSVIRQRAKSVLFERLPNEVAVAIAVESGQRFLMSHGLHDDSDDFTVLTETQMLDYLKPSLREEVLSFREEALS